MHVPSLSARTPPSIEAVGWSPGSGTVGDAAGPGSPRSGAWLRRLREAAAREGGVTDMVIVGDFGKDQDDEKALLIAAALRRVGIVGRLSIVANLGDSAMRARLAKGTMQALGDADVRVAAGSDGGRRGEELHEYEFAHCAYLAGPADLSQQAGHELFFSALHDARGDQRRVCVVLNSALTDMAKIVADARWRAWARPVVACVAVMGGLREGDAGGLVMDPTAQNCAFDVAAASLTYARLQEDLKQDFVVVTRHAASACQLPRRALDEAGTHPVALRLSSVARPSLQKLWERVHRSKREREEHSDALPMRCDVEWYRTTFLEPDAPPALGASDDVWEYVRGFNEYDGLTVIAAALAPHPRLLNQFFSPYICPHSGALTIGLSAAEHGVTDPEGATELLHDLIQLVLAVPPCDAGSPRAFGARTASTQLQRQQSLQRKPSERVAL